MKENDLTTSYRKIKATLDKGGVYTGLTQQVMFDVALQLSMFTYDLEEVKRWASVADPKSVYDPIMFAMNAGNYEAVRFLLTKGWDLSTLVKWPHVHLNNALIGSHRTTMWLSSIIGCDDSYIVKMLDSIYEWHYKKITLSEFEQHFPNEYNNCPHTHRNIFVDANDNKLRVATRDIVLRRDDIIGFHSELGVGEVWGSK